MYSICAWISILILVEPCGRGKKSRNLTTPVCTVCIYIYQDDKSVYRPEQHQQSFVGVFAKHAMWVDQLYHNWIPDQLEITS